MFEELNIVLLVCDETVSHLSGYVVGIHIPQGSCIAEENVQHLLILISLTHGVSSNNMQLQSRTS